MLFIVSKHFMHYLGVVLDCYSGSVSDYDGHQQTTASGRQCLRWDQFDYSKPADFPDASVYDAANFCRSVNYHEPWCFILESSHWENCSIYECGEQSFRIFLYTVCGN